MELLNLDRETFLERIPQFVALHRCCFPNGHTDADYFKWRYLDHPAPEQFVNIAVDGDALVAFYAVSTVLLTYQKETWKSALSLNSMTSPEYRGKGLFTSLARLTYEQLHNSGYGSIFGFSNVHSNSIFCKKLDFRTVYEVPMMELVLNQEVEVRSCIDYDNEFRMDYSEVQKETDRLMVKKNVPYLRWRYTQSPECQYDNIVLHSRNQVKAYAVCKVWQDRLNIVEFHGDTERYGKELLSRCMDHAHQKGLQAVTIWAPVNTPLHWLLEREGFINRYPIHYFIAKALKPLPVDLSDPRIWALQMGDNNTY